MVTVGIIQFFQGVAAGAENEVFLLGVGYVDTHHLGPAPHHPRFPAAVALTVRHPADNKESVSGQ